MQTTEINSYRSILPQNRDRLIDAIAEIYKFTVLLRDEVDYPIDRYSERQEQAAKAGIELDRTLTKIQPR